MIRKLLIPAVGLLIATCIAVRGQTPAPTPKAPEERATGTISGSVVNDNGQPLAGASLFLSGIGLGGGPRTTMSDGEGNFIFNRLDPGLYTIFGNAPAFVNEPDPAAPATYYRVGDSVRLEFVRGGVITGAVTNSLGDPVIGVRVRATRIRDGRGQPPKLPMVVSYGRPTDDRGIYRIYGLPSGTYVVSAGGVTAGFAGNFSPYTSDIPTYAPSSTRDTAAEISVRAGEEANVDVRYRGEPGFSISGTVNGVGNNVATVTLSSVSNSVGITTPTQFPNNRGFSFSGLADGEYKLVAQQAVSASPSGPTIWAMSEIKRVTVKGASVTGIELTPKPLATVNGQIVVEPAKVPECVGKRPPLLSETLVHLRRHEKEIESDDLTAGRMAASSAVPDSNGAFLLRNLVPGRYQFDTRFYARYWYLQSITINTMGAKPQKVDAASNWIAVRSGEQLRTVTITLAAGAASIRGQLAQAEGTPPTHGKFVYLLPAEPKEADNVLRFFVVEVAPDGAFALNNLAPGKYLVFTQSNVDAQIGTLTKLRQAEAAPLRAKLRQTAVAQKTEIELKPCQNLSDYQLK